jgi:hypothetical protein
MPGMLGQNDVGGTDRIMDHTEASQPNLDLLPDPDDPATAGCLLALLGGQVTIRRRGQWVVEWRGMAPLAPGFGSVSRSVTGTGSTLGRAIIAAAIALGRWPGGDR